MDVLNLHGGMELRPCDPVVSTHHHRLLSAELKHCSRWRPGVSPAQVEDLTVDQVKSHLQKQRLDARRSAAEALKVRGAYMPLGD